MKGHSQKRPKSSLVWQYGELLVRLIDKTEVFYCYDCERRKVQRLPVAGNKGTTGARMHLQKEHFRDMDGEGDVVLPALKNVKTLDDEGV